MCDGEPRKVCIYNPAHYILVSRYAKHIAQCSKNYPSMTFEDCPYNSTHKVKTLEFQHHIENCPDKIVMDRYKIRVGGQVQSIDNLVVKNTEFDEDWTTDNKVSYLAYQEKVISKKPILRMGETNIGKASRKQRLADEKERLQNLQKE